jgi:endoglucanase
VPRNVARLKKSCSSSRRRMVAVSFGLLLGLPALGAGSIEGARIAGAGLYLDGGSAPQSSDTSASGKGSLPQGSAPQGSAPQGSAPQGSAPQGSAPQGSAPQGGSQQGSASPYPAPNNKAVPPPAGGGKAVSLHTAGSKVVDGSGHEVVFTGVAWFGFETRNFAPDGLWARNWQDMLDQMKAAGFNTLRLPYSNQLLDDPSAVPTGIDYTKNPDLKGLKGLALMDKIVDGAGQRGLKVILDRHRPTADGQTDLWYTDQVPESRWIADWTMLARHYKGDPAVIGADLHNEPHGRATWGDGNPKTDWRLAAERGGNAILAVSPNWLIFVEGIETYHGDAYWWGGNLEGAGQYPVRLSVPGRLVYSPHDYGPSVFNQSWFNAPDFPKNLPAIWQKHWGYLAQQHTAPLVMGEFGGRSVGQDVEGTWQRSLLAYLKANGMGYWYWAWNADSGDTGGVLQDDWKSVSEAKLRMIQTYQWPALGGASNAKLPDVFHWPAK